MYQQGTKYYMPISITGISLESVSSIEFMFKQVKDMTASPLKTALWVAEDENETAFITRDSSGNDVIAIVWTKAETYLFKSGQLFYIHARIHLADSDVNPPVLIVPIMMNETLFNSSEVVSG